MKPKTKEEYTPEERAEVDALVMEVHDMMSKKLDSVFKKLGATASLTVCFSLMIGLAHHIAKCKGVPLKAVYQKALETEQRRAS